MRKVLIIDDDEGLLKVLTVSLEEQGFQVLSTMQGETGLQIAKTEHPDIILLDIILTDIPGLEVLNRIKDDPQTAGVPIIMLTSYKNTKVESEAQKLGVSGYLLKYQIQMKDVGTYIKKLLDNHDDAPI